MENLNIHQVTGRNDDSFIGIKIKNKTIDFFYPETYDLADLTTNVKRFRSDVLSILKTISIAKTLDDTKARIESNLADDESFALVSYLWIINDYILNDIYVNREKEFKSNQRGRINWKRTMKNQPIISNGNVIYSNIVVEVRNEMDNIIADIHKLCIKRSIEIIGWLFNLNASRIETKPFNPKVKKQYTLVLNSEIDKTFDDNKKMRLTHMLKVLKGLNDNNNDSDEFVYGVDSYYYIFERMVNSIFGNKKELKRFNPKANWYLVMNDFKKTPSTELKPDTILVKNKIAYILDSKYYRFGFTGLNSDLPETTSIQKQITYGDYLKKNTKLEVDDVRNGFILPFNQNNNKFSTNELIHYIGFSTAEWKDNTNVKHESIYAFLVDTKHIIEHWNKSYHDEDVEKLVDKIEKAVVQRESLK